MPLAQQLTNVGARGQDARYSIAGLQEVAPGIYSDGVYQYDSNGLDLSGRPAQNIPGLRGADENYVDGQVSYAGGGSGGDGGGGGDLLSSPYFQQALAAFKAQNAADESATKAKLRQMLIDTGLVPQGFTDNLGILDDVTKQLIQKNTDTGISQYARLLSGKEDQQRNDINSLASSGLLRSGAKGFKLRRSSLAFDRNKADLLSGVSGAANDALAGLAQRQLQGQQSLAQFLAQLASQMSLNSGYRVGGAPPVAPPPVVSQTPQTSAPWDHLGIGVPDTQGYSTKTGGGYYTNPQSGALTSKWQNLAKAG
jgi:hypothetical protein